MIQIFKMINKRINGVIWSLFSTGILLLMLSVLIVWTDFVLRIVVGVFVLVIAYVFIYCAYKVWSIKKEIEKHLKKL
jgi:ABC-type bacteriocin/lantibiotic exporter with double-glycine peptidase domain